MSRTRIVKGKITEVIGKDYSIFSESNIVDIATELITEKGETNGISFQNPSKPAAGEIKAKCLVQFRPHDTYKDNPEFGFDWLRAGDSGQPGDNWFGNIMGKYYKLDNVTLFDDTNKWSPNFKKESDMYDKKLKSYKSFSINWKKVNKKPYLYTIPTLTLLKGKTAIFNLKIEIQEKPKKLSFEFKEKNAEDYLTLNLKEIGDIKRGKYDKFNYLKITCKESFDKEQILYVKADGEICGAMRIHPNSSQFKRNIKIAFVKVKTNINGTITIGKPVTGGKDFFTKCCNQALVIPSIVEEKNALDCTNNTFGGLFGKDFKDFAGIGKLSSGINGQKIIKTAGMKDYLEGRLKSQFGDKYKGYTVLYFIGEEANWNGFSNYGWTTCVQFGRHNKATIAHETIHSLYLPHTFASISERGAVPKYTYEATKTNNLMDYSHVAQPPIERFSLFIWQWNVLNNKIKI